MGRLARRHAISILQIILLSGISTAVFGEEMQHDYAPAERPAMDHSQMDHSRMDHSMMDHAMPGHSGPASKPAAKMVKPKKKPAGHAGHAASAVHANDHGRMNHGKMDHSRMNYGAAGHGMAMMGLLGPYTQTREGSGTSWVPEATRTRASTSNWPSGA